MLMSGRNVNRDVALIFSCFQISYKFLTFNEYN